MGKQAQSNQHKQLLHLGKVWENGLWTEEVARGAARLQAAVDSGRAILKGAAVIELSSTEKSKGQITPGRLSPSALLGTALIEEGATVGIKAVLGDGVSLRDHATVEREAELRDEACVGNWSTVREGAIINAGCFIGSCGVTVKAGVEVPAGTSVFDHSPHPSIYAEIRS